MNPVTMLIGAAALAYGIYTLYLRQSAPEKFGKLAAMKKQWGPTAGNAVHLVAYSILPLVFGIVLLVTGWQGAGLF